MLLKQPTCGKLIHHYGDGKTKVNFSNNWLQSQFRRFLVVSLLKKHTKHRTVRVCMCVSKRKKDLKKGGGNQAPGCTDGKPQASLYKLASLSGSGPPCSWEIRLPPAGSIPRHSVCVRACMCNVCVFIGSSHLNGERKLPNGQTGNPTFTPYYFNTLPFFTAHSPPPALSVTSSRRWADISMPMAGCDRTNED